MKEEEDMEEKRFNIDNELEMIKLLHDVNNKRRKIHRLPSKQKFNGKPKLVKRNSYTNQGNKGSQLKQISLMKRRS